jgi:hypothetical protein
MDQFLIDIAQHATWNRLLPFPNAFRISTNPDEPHTIEEFDKFINALSVNEPEALKYATTINLDIAQHNKNSIHPTITEFEFQYSYMDNYKKNLKYPNRWYLFHGSPLGNWHSILRSGIKNMSGTRFMSTGQAHGPGVYASQDLRVAASYGQSHNKIYVAVLELLVDPEPFKKTPVIYVIPDDKILFPRYLFVITKMPTFDGHDILAYYKKIREGLIKPNTKLKRLEMDCTKISAYIVDKINTTCLLLNIDSVLVRCYVINYPFKSPVLQLCNIISSSTHAKYFDEYGCYIYPYNEWTAQNTIIDVIDHLRKTACLNTLAQKKEEYGMLEEL